MRTAPSDRDTPMMFDAARARRIADLPVYLRQNRSELGELVSKLNDASWL